MVKKYVSQISKNLSDNFALRKNRLHLNDSLIHEKTGISRSTLLSISKSETKMIQFSVLERLSKALECEPYELLKPIKL